MQINVCVCVCECVSVQWSHIQNALEPKRLATNWCMLSAHTPTHPHIAAVSTKCVRFLLRASPASREEPKGTTNHKMRWRYIVRVGHKTLDHACHNHMQVCVRASVPIPVAVLVAPFRIGVLPSYTQFLINRPHN